MRLSFRGGCHQAVFIAGHAAVGVRRRLALFRMQTPARASAARTIADFRSSAPGVYIPGLIRPPRRLVHDVVEDAVDPRSVFAGLGRAGSEKRSNTWRLTSGSCRACRRLKTALNICPCPTPAP